MNFYDSKPKHYMNVYVNNKNIVKVIGVNQENQNCLSRFYDYVPIWAKKLIENGTIYRLSLDDLKDNIYCKTSEGESILLTIENMVLLENDNIKIIDRKSFNEQYTKVMTAFLD